VIHAEWKTPPVILLKSIIRKIVYLKHLNFISPN